MKRETEQSRLDRERNLNETEEEVLGNLPDRFGNGVTSGGIFTASSLELEQTTRVT